MSFFKDINSIIQWYTKEAKPMNEERRREIVEESKRDWIDDLINARYEMMRQGVREYVELTDNPDLDDLIYRMDLSPAEKRYVENIYAVEMERKERASA